LEVGKWGQAISLNRLSDGLATAYTMPRHQEFRDISPSISPEGSTVPSIPVTHISPVRYTGPPPKSILRQTPAEGSDRSHSTLAEPLGGQPARRQQSRSSDDRRTDGRSSETKPRRRREAPKSRHPVSASRVPQVKHDARDRDTHRGGHLGTETTGSRRVRSGCRTVPSVLSALSAQTGMPVVLSNIVQAKSCPHTEIPSHTDLKVVRLR